MSQLATEKIQNLCNRNRWSGLLQLGSVRFRSFFQSSELDLRTLIVQGRSGGTGIGVDEDERRKLKVPKVYPGGLSVTLPKGVKPLKCTFRVVHRWSVGVQV